MFNRFFAGHLVLLLLWGCGNNNTGKLFELVSPDDTGIYFSNNLVLDDDSLTVLDFEYKYDGGGVGLGDINNDGLTDIYLTGNMVSSRLYLNKGDWEFEDITDQAGVGTVNWANGVSMVDINQDGFLDIYVCMSGHRNQPEEVKKNRLFINNKDNTFTESAASYGLDDMGYSIQATFLDYDKDGDLDMYLLENGLVRFNRNTPREVMKNGKAITTDKLFRNNGDNTFTDVSAQAGILIEGFGLGVQTCDINEDGWPDVYVSNDFLTNDLIWVNNGDGTFTDKAFEYLKHQTHNGMGCDLADINNDGLLDIGELDMLPEDNKQRKLTTMGSSYDVFLMRLHYGYQPQYIRNTLQLNNGNGTFSEIGQLAGIQATDWSWSLLFADYDNDGYKDAFVSNGYRQNITNLDFIMYSQNLSTFGNAGENRKQKIEALYAIEGVKLSNYMFRNKGNLTFENTTEDWGMNRPSYSNGAAYADLDNDGDLDYVINNIDEEPFIYRNKLNEGKEANAVPAFLRVALHGPEKNRQGIGARVYLNYGDKKQYLYMTPSRGYLSSVEPVLHFGLGETNVIDSLRIIWPDGKTQALANVAVNQLMVLEHSQAMDKPIPGSRLNQTLFVERADSLGIDLFRKENSFVDFNVQPTLPHMHSLGGPGIAVGDIDQDGLEDFFVGGATGHTGRFFFQDKDGRFKEKPLVYDSMSEDMGILFFDADNDGDQDLYVVSGGSSYNPRSKNYQDRLYLNDGRGGFSKAENTLPSMRSSGSSVVAADFDHDGDLDLFVGGRVSPREYPVTPRSYLLRNDSQPTQVKFTDVTNELAPGLSEIGMITSALWTDYDNDGWADLLIAGEFMPLVFYHNNAGKLEDHTQSTGLINTNGWWNSLVACDFDQDGDMDYVAGNLGLNSFYKASATEPVEIYASDFDNDGRMDPMITHYNQGKKYLVHTRDEVINQINAMRGRFKTYEEYASADFAASFLEEELTPARVLKSERFESSYIENLGDGNFAIRALPIEAQVSPVFGMSAADYNGDGLMDLVLVGNSYATEPNMGWYDASVGLLLQGNGAGDFSAVNVNQSGFFADKDAKGMATLVNSMSGRLQLVGNNVGPMNVLASQVKLDKYIQIPDQAAYGRVQLKNGQSYRIEFYYGNTYLSHSSRKFFIHPEIDNIEVFDAKGSPLSVDR